MLDDYFYPDTVVDKWMCRFPQGNFKFCFLQLTKHHDLLPYIDTMPLGTNETDEFPEEEIIRSMDKWYADKTSHKLEDVKFRLVLCFNHARSIMQLLSDTRRLLERLRPANITLTSVMCVVKPQGVQDPSPLGTNMCLEVCPTTLGIWPSFLRAANKKEQEDQRKAQEEREQLEEDARILRAACAPELDGPLSFDMLEQMFNKK
jgi:hypothetical protein